MSRMYVATFTDIAVSAAVDLFEIVPGSGLPTILHAIVIGQASDEGDAAAELLRLSIIKAHSTSGSGGSAVTPVALDNGTQAYGGTVERTNTTQATSGSPVTLLSDTFNVATGWQYCPPPEQRITMAAGIRHVLAMEAPADALTMSGYLILEEVG